MGVSGGDAPPHGTKSWPTGGTRGDVGHHPQPPVGQVLGPMGDQTWPMGGGGDVRASP
jgi:hypothetical protein